MNIKEETMFRTPDNVEEIQNWIELHNTDEKAHLYVAMMMTWNYLASKVNNGELTK